MNSADIQNQRTRIHGLLSAALQESQRTGKPLLILAGEGHSSKESLLNNLLLMQEAQALGIRETAIEMSEVSREVPEAFRNNADAQHKGQGSALSLAPILFPERHFTAIDTAKAQTRAIGTSSDQGLHIRDEAMASHLGAAHEPTFAIVGNNHLAGVNEALGDTHTVISFNTAPIGTPEVRAAALQERPYMAERIRYLEGDNVIQLGNTPLAGNASTADIVKAALGTEAETALAHARNAGFRIEGDTSPTLDHLQEAIGKGRYIGGKRQSTEALQELRHALESAGYDLSDNAMASNRITSEDREAIRHFQHDHHLRADGIVGPRTLAGLEQALASVKEQGIATTLGQAGATATTDTNEIQSAAIPQQQQRNHDLRR